jgi:hypothetical protein
MQATGYSVDAARGHDHPDSTAARQARIQAFKIDQAVRHADFQACLRLITRLARSTDDAVQVLHALTAGLKSPLYKNPDIEAAVEEIDLLADSLEYGDEA